MPKAAQINAESTVVGVSYLTRQFNHPALVWLPMDSPDVIGTVYEPGAGTFTRPAQIDPDTGEEITPAEVVYTLGAQ